MRQIKTEKGSVILEYALTVSLIALVAMFALAHTSRGVNDTFFSVGDSLQTASNNQDPELHAREESGGSFKNDELGAGSEDFVNGHGEGNGGSGSNEGGGRM